MRREATELGEALLAEGRVAVLVMAGGQGTRLGFPGPKGALPLGPVSGRTLFGLQAEKLRGAARRCGRRIPWLVMTSAATEAATRALFDRSAHFGLPPEDVWLFCQGSSPCIDFEGRLLLESPGRIAEAPDGHGGALPALVETGLAARLEERGVALLSSYQVDNPLAPVADPLFLGLHRLRGAQMSCKVLEKRTPEESAGTVGALGGRVRVVEYTEVDAAHRDAREADGRLRFWAASIAMHVLDVGLVRRVGASPERWLPHHASRKKIPCIDPEGKPVVPTAPNGYKLERFIFDALGAASDVALLEVRREEEYSPIKSPTGEFTPEAARRALSARAESWLRSAGVAGIEPGEVIELDHARIDGESDARRTGLRHVSEAHDWILRGGGETR